MRTEQADIWLGFTAEEIAGFFETAGLIDQQYVTLGIQ